MRHPAIAALVIAGALPLAGCAATATAPSPPPGIDLEAFDPAGVPGNGLWLLTADAAAEEVVAAVGVAGSVHYTAAFTELTPGTPETEPAPGRSLTVDFTGGPGASRAAITAGDLVFEVVLVDGRSYVRGNAAYATHVGIAEVGNGFVCTIGEAAFLDEWAPLLRPADLVSSLLGASESMAVEAPAGEETTVSVVIGSAEGPIGTMTVQRTGAPLPVSFTAGDASGDGHFAFTGWGEPVAVQAPADTVVDCA
ncbi:MAG: hypothetical protein M3Y52_01040 [Actinomycetota bacterium]|nr:hypothetical protein [Actinomycetota bacterium]